MILFILVYNIKQNSLYFSSTLCAKQININLHCIESKIGTPIITGKLTYYGISSSKVYINGEGLQKNVTIELYCTEGKLIETKMIGDILGEFSLDLIDIATIDSGVYYIILKTDGHIKAFIVFHKI